MAKPALAVENGLWNAAAETATGLPPVIVLNLFHSGLGIVRQLSGKGVRVVGLSAHPRIYGSFTRLCEVHGVPNSQEQPEELADFLLHAASRWRGAIVFPTRDADVLFLDRFRGDLEQYYKLAIPSTEVLLRVMNKGALAELAAGEGIPVPPTTVVSNAVQLKQGADAVGFPCVVKPVSSIHWRRGNNWNLVGARKAFRVNSLAELEREYGQISQAYPEILLQGWIPGATDQIVVWGGYLRPGAEPPTCFTARKIVQSPPEFGTGCVVESEFIPELLEPSLRLCRALGYEGMAEIEYKRDVRDGRCKLIEINVRHWDWHQLGNASGVDLTWAAYCHLSGNPMQPVDAPVRRVQWIAEDSLLTQVLSELSRGEFDRRMAMRLISARHMCSIFAWRDPLPFLRYFATVVLPGVARGAARKIRHRIVGKEIIGPAITLAANLQEGGGTERVARTWGLESGQKNRR